ncbi:hypothetical protein KJ596_00170 [Patescibacteria group bacterium]|nr:hypothetical protein [Patescibacteria group bacterium]MBU1868556.1 hypothetical protein [Patescibacteria group bacterium]
MQIYITTSPQNIGFYTRTKEILENLGHSASASPLIANIANQKINDLGQLYDLINTHVSTVDAVIADFSFPYSTPILEATLALKQGRHVLALAEQGKINNPPAFLTKGNHRFTYKTYARKTLAEIIKDFCGETAKNLGSKFFMILPPELDRYLNWITATSETSKAEIVRKGIREVIKKDISYQKFLKKNTS